MWAGCLELGAPTSGSKPNPNLKCVSVIPNQVCSARTRSYAEPMTDEQEQKPSYKHYSGMPLWAKLALIGAVIAAGILYATFG